MDILPIFDEYSPEKFPCCVAQYQEKTINHVAVYADFIKPGQVLGLISSQVCGGNFRQYLKDCGGDTCLYLEPMAHSFSLPCYDGQGLAVFPEELEQYQKRFSVSYSSDLCVNYLYLSEEARILLFDDDRSLREKCRLAREEGVRLLIARPEVLEKIKAP